MFLRRLFSRHSAELFRLARRVTGRDADAEEAVSDVFCALTEGRGQIERGRDPLPYLRRAVTNRSLNILRRRRLAPQPVPTTILDRQAAQCPSKTPGRCTTMFRDGIARLPERQAQAFTLRHLHQLSVAEVAEVMSVKPATVRVHLHQATRRLRVLFDPKEASRVE